MLYREQFGSCFIAQSLARGQCYTSVYLSIYLLIHLPNHLSSSIFSNTVLSFLPLIPSVLLFSPYYSNYLTLPKANRRPIPVPSDERTLENVEDKDLVLRELLTEKRDLEFCNYIKTGGHNPVHGP